MPLRIEVGLSPGDSELDGDPTLPSSKRGGAPQVSAHVYCGQTAAFIKIPLGMEVGLSPDDFVLHREPAPLRQKGVEPQIFGPYLLWPNGCMDQDATWYRGRPWPSRHCVTWGPSFPSPKRGRIPLPHFRPMSIVAKRLDASR